MMVVVVAVVMGVALSTTTFEYFFRGFGPFIPGISSLSIISVATWAVVIISKILGP
jgi:hypothetical protein